MSLRNDLLRGEGACEHPLVARQAILGGGGDLVIVCVGCGKSERPRA